MLRSSLLTLLLAFSVSVHAEDFNYDYVSFGYGNVDFDGVSADGDGFVLDVALGLTDNVHLFAGYDDADANSFAGVSRWNAGVGYNSPFSDTVDLFGRLSYESVDFDTPFGNADDNGYGASVGARFRAGNQMEVKAALNYVDYSDLGDDTGLELGVLYNFTNNWSAGLTGKWSDDVKTYTIGARYYFGN
jgi:hypothetical protein